MNESGAMPPLISDLLIVRKDMVLSLSWYLCVRSLRPIPVPHIHSTSTVVVVLVTSKYVTQGKC